MRATVYPRWRGEHSGTRGGRAWCLRFIPAGAGNTLPFPEFRPLNWVYPRWRGEHSCAIKIRLSHAGLSPLARGTLIIDDNSTDRQQFIPAGAGNTIIGNLSWTGTAVYPRWRGEHNNRQFVLDRHGSLSPLARGTRIWRPTARRNPQFIPAGAGNTLNVCHCL